MEPQHIKKISDAYWKFKDDEGFVKIESNKNGLSNNGNLSLQLYVKQAVVDNIHNTKDLIEDVKVKQEKISRSIKDLFTQLEKIGNKA